MTSCHTGDSGNLLDTHNSQSTSARLKCKETIQKGPPRLPLHMRPARSPPPNPCTKHTSRR